MTDGIKTTSTIKDLKDILSETSTFLIDVMGKDWQMFATKYNFALKDYLDKKLNNIATFKLLITASVVKLEHVYVQQHLQFNDKKHHQNKIYTLLGEKKKIVISAQAGAGKSCLLKSWVLEIIREKKPYLPIFYELKTLNSDNSSILEGVLNDIKVFNTKFSEENLKFILNNKKTILFLDAFDEISHLDKMKFQQEINTISAIYPNLKIVISSRPETEVFDTWSKFDVFEIADININQAINIVKKLGYDKETVNRFVKSLEDSLFETHNEFAKNPLLLTIMLMTYEQFSDVPTKMHIFYEQAFLVLFNRHDSFKDGFKRDMLTSLDSNQFKKAFSTFCFASYCKDKFSFEEDYLLDLLDKSLTANKLKDVSKEDFSIELQKHVPLLCKDGLKICFSHRSFQEYFTALHIVSKGEIPDVLLKKFIYRDLSDKVFNMIYDLDNDFFENIIILPKINQFLGKFKKDDDLNETLDEILDEMFEFRVIGNRFLCLASIVLIINLMIEHSLFISESFTSYPSYLEIKNKFSNEDKNRINNSSFSKLKAEEKDVILQHYNTTHLHYLIDVCLEIKQYIESDNLTTDDEEDDLIFNY